jgi:hypothetical protein
MRPAQGVSEPCLNQVLRPQLKCSSMPSCENDRAGVHLGSVDAGLTLERSSYTWVEGMCVCVCSMFMNG